MKLLAILPSIQKYTETDPSSRVVGEAALGRRGWVIFITAAATHLAMASWKRPILCGHWQPTQGTRETQGKATQQPGHCTPLFLALALAYEQKQTWQRSRIVVCRIARLNISHSPAL